VSREFASPSPRCSGVGGGGRQSAGTGYNPQQQQAEGGKQPPRKKEFRVKAMLGDVVIAEAAKEDLISIEGNWYFPPDSVKSEFLVESATPYTCPWKGEAQYFGVKDGDTVLQDRAWSYPNPYSTAYDRVGKEFGDYVAFWKDVTVVD
jgi:uncharacterized protein (DUF427 family)